MRRPPLNAVNLETTKAHIRDRAIRCWSHRLPAPEDQYATQSTPTVSNAIKSREKSIALLDLPSSDGRIQERTERLIETVISD